MREHWHMVWLIAQRELRDQLRDWRVLTPLVFLTVAFPFLMDAVAHQAVAFFAKYGTPLIADRLVPFSVLIIGFFPITISLVSALEAFVGEKERGTIEPLLSAPIKNWHLYTGKLLVGVIVPLLASYTSIFLYLLMISHERLQMPSTYTLSLLLLLTAAHAVLMVSAAMVVSVQSTSVRAASLLASFIIIPVAILMQGESAMLFWGTDRVLWLAVAGVILIAVLLVRLGIAHFQREYLLSREFDSLNLRWAGKTFWAHLRGPASSLSAWYRLEVWRVVRQLAVPFLLMAAIAAVGYWASYRWAVLSVPKMAPNVTSHDFEEIARAVSESVGFAQLRRHISAGFIFTRNVRALSFMLLGGLVSFSVLGLVMYLINISAIGLVLGIFKAIGYSPMLLFASGLLPHGIFELPALMLASATVLRIGLLLVTPQTGKSMGEVILAALADWAKVFFGLVVPLLAVAALVETYITPLLLTHALNLP